MPAFEPKRVSTGVYLDAAIFESAKEKAWAERTSFSAVVNELLERWVNGEFEINHTCD